MLAYAYQCFVRNVERQGAQLFAKMSKQLLGFRDGPNQVALKCVVEGVEGASALAATLPLVKPICRVRSEWTAKQRGLRGR